MTQQWTVEDIIDAHDLDHRRAMALIEIIASLCDVGGGVDRIISAIWHLRRLRANSGLLLSAASVFPLDPDEAKKITGEAIAAAFQIRDGDLIEALRCLIPESNVLMQSVHGLTDDIEAAIAALEHYTTEWARDEE